MLNGPHKGKLSPSKRSRIWEKHLSDLKMKQENLAAWARKEFNLPKLSQATISNVLKEFRVTGAKTNNLTMEQALMIYEKANEGGSKMTQKDLGAWAKRQLKLEKPPCQGTISNILNKKRSLEPSISERDLQMRRKRVVKCPSLDVALAEWTVQCQNAELL